MAEGGPEAGGLGGQVGSGVDQAGPEDAVGFGRQLAAHRPAGDGGGDPVELVEEAGDGVALGIELDGAARLVAQEQEAQQLGRQQLRDLVRRRARPLATCSSSGRRC